MIATLDIVKGAYQLLGRPSQQDLPYMDLVDHATDVLNGRLLDMKLTARNKALEFSSWYTPTSQNVEFDSFNPDSDSMLSVRMEWRPLNSDDTYIPNKVDLVGYDNLAEVYQLGSTVVASIYNDSDGDAYVAFPEPVSILATREYRLVYDSLENGELPDIFLPLCKYETAFWALDQVRNSSDEWQSERERLRPVFAMKVKEWTDRFNKVNKHTGNTRIRKIPFRVRGRVF